MSALKFSIEFEKPLRYPDFDPKVLKPSFRKMGREVAKIVRKLVSQKGVSRANQYPGMDTGQLRRTTRVRVSRSGFSVAIKADGKGLTPFYPAFVYYGHRAPHTDSKQQHGKTRVGKKVVAPRKNWIVDAVEMYGKQRYQAEMRAIMESAIKPGVVQGLFK